MTDTATGVVMVESFERGFERFRQETGGELRDVMRPLAGLLAQKCYEWTRPKKMSGSRGQIRKSVNRVLRTGSDKYISMLYTRFGSSHIADQEMMTSGGGTYRLQDLYVRNRYSLSDFDALHKSRRDGNGAVPKGKGTIILTTKNARERYIKHVMKRAGKEKAGWTPAMSDLKAVKKVPAWVTNAGNTAGHSGRVGQSGAVNDAAISKDKIAGYIDIFNTAPYAHDRNKKTIASATRFIEKQVAGKHFQAWIDKLIARKNQEVGT